MAKSRVVIRDRGGAAIIAALESAGRSYVQVGVQGDMTYPDGNTQADVATWMEFGTSNPDGSVRVPARPFMRTTVDETAEEFARLQQRILQRIIDGKISVEQGMGLMGEFLKSRVQRKIASNIPPKNADSTIAKKKSSRTLIDTGQLRQSITYTATVAKVAAKPVYKP